MLLRSGHHEDGKVSISSFDGLRLGECTDPKWVKILEVRWTKMNWEEYNEELFQRWCLCRFRPFLQLSFNVVIIKPTYNSRGEVSKSSPYLDYGFYPKSLGTPEIIKYDVVVGPFRPSMKFLVSCMLLHGFRGTSTTTV